MCDSFTCRGCKDKFLIEEASKATKITKDGVGKCKPCHNERVRNYHLEKKVALSPQNHFQCNNCDRYMNKYADRWRKKPPITKCKYCNSEDIEDVI